MATKISVSVLVSLAFVVHFAITTAATTKPITITESTSLAIKLIHSDSILSPYTPNNTIADHFASITKKINRTSCFLAQQDEEASDDNDYLSNLVPSPKDGVFLMNFSIGESPVPQLAVMDTGSGLKWVKFPLRTLLSAIYSSIRSFQILHVFSDCSNCNVNGQCPYKKEYVGSESSEGIYGREQLAFETSDDSIVKVPSMTFGCSHKFGNFSIGYQGINGVFGLSNGSFSTVSNFGKKFSYCIGNLREANYKYNQLVLGDKANIEGDSTPLRIINGLYYINLEGISIGGQKLDIDPIIFIITPDLNSGTIIDSGTDHTWLARNGFEVLSIEVENLLRRVVTRNKGNPWTLCYSGVASRDLGSFPVVTFHFDQGAVLDLDAGSMFIQTSENEFFMAVLPGNYHGDDY